MWYFQKTSPSTASDWSGNEQQHISEYKGNNRTIYTISSAKRDGKDKQQSSRGEFWTSASKEVALEAAGGSSWHWDSDIQHSHTLWHATGIASPPAHEHRRTRRGPGGKAASICVGCTHTLILAHTSSPSSAEQDRHRAHGQQSLILQLCQGFSSAQPSHPKRSLKLYTSYIRQNWECCHVSYKQKNSEIRGFTLQELLHLH